MLETIQHTALASPWPELLDRAVHGDSAFCLVATPETDGGSETPIGYALALDGDLCYLAEIAVHPGYRRAGHGSALLACVVDWTDTDEIRLTVRADDPTAKAFYVTHDFREIDRLPGHYDDGSSTRDGLLLSKPL